MRAKRVPGEDRREIEFNSVEGQINLARRVLRLDRILSLRISARRARTSDINCRRRGEKQVSGGTLFSLRVGGARIRRPRQIIEKVF